MTKKEYINLGVKRFFDVYDNDTTINNDAIKYAELLNIPKPIMGEWQVLYSLNVRSNKHPWWHLYFEDIYEKMTLEEQLKYFPFEGDTRPAEYYKQVKAAVKAEIIKLLKFYFKNSVNPSYAQVRDQVISMHFGDIFDTDLIWANEDVPYYKKGIGDSLRAINTAYIAASDTVWKKRSKKTGLWSFDTMVKENAEYDKYMDVFTKWKTDGEEELALRDPNRNYPENSGSYSKQLSNAKRYNVPDEFIEDYLLAYYTYSGIVPENLKTKFKNKVVKSIVTKIEEEPTLYNKFAELLSPKRWNLPRDIKMVFELALKKAPKWVTRSTRGSLWDFNRFVKESAKWWEGRINKEDIIDLFEYDKIHNDVPKKWREFLKDIDHWARNITPSKFGVYRESEAEEYAKDHKDYELFSYMIALSNQYLTSISTLYITYTFKDEIGNGSGRQKAGKFHLLPNLEEIRMEVIDILKDYINEKIVEILEDDATLYPKYKGYLYFFAKLPSWISRSDKSGLLGMKTESVTPDRIFNILSGESVDDIVKLIIEILVDNDLYLSGKAGGIYTPGALSKVRIYTGVNDITVVINSFNLNFKISTTQYDKYIEVLDIAKKLQARPALHPELTDTKLTWYKYFDMFEETEKGKIYMYLFHHQLDYGIDKEWLEDNKHYVRSKKGGLWDYKTFINK